jgi:hypothetical protein
MTNIKTSADETVIVIEEIENTFNKYAVKKAEQDGQNFCDEREYMDCVTITESLCRVIEKFMINDADDFINIVVRLSCLYKKGVKYDETHQYYGSKLAWPIEEAILAINRNKIKSKK